MNKLIAEFIGTFFLVFAIVMTAGTGNALAGIAIGATLMVMVYAGGHISGAHYNPAVTVAAFLRGAAPVKDVAPYIATQVIAAAAAGAVGRQIAGLEGSAVAMSGDAITNSLLMEIIWTFALAWVVLNVATSKDHPNNHFYGLAIGFTVLAGAIATGQTFNPAVGVGISVAGMGAWADIWVHIVGPLVGGAAAAYAFKAANPGDA